MFRFLAFSLALLLIPSPADAGGVPAKADPFAAIDRHALAASPRDEKTSADLAAYLTRPFKEDRDKARAIFRWLTDRIAYDADVVLKNKPIGDCSADTVLKTRKTVCEGYSNLFLKLAQAAGMDAVKIRGHSKGFGYLPGEKITTNHAWNAVKVDGVWKLIDCTWAAGSVEEGKGFTRALEDFYFLAPPDYFILNHLPEEPRWQLLDPPVAKEVYAAWPRVEVSALQMGVPARDLKSLLSRKDFPGLVQTFADVRRIRLLEGPLEKRLVAGKTYRFKIESPGCLELAAIRGDKWTHARASKGIFELTVTPEPGTLGIFARFSPKDARFWTLLEYVVD